MPQDQDDIKGADAMKQAPTPGPLDSESVKLLVKGDLLLLDGQPVRFINLFMGGIRADDGSDKRISALPVERFAFIDRPDADGWMPWSGGENPVPGQRVELHMPSGITSGVYASEEIDWADPRFRAFRLAPTAPVEASGSEREFETVEAMAEAWSDRVEIQRMVETTSAVFAKWASPELLSRFRQQMMAVIQQAYIEGVGARVEALRPQPSGETRALIGRLTKALDDATMLPGVNFKPDVSCDDLRAILSLLSVRPAPVASGGQHSSGEGEGCGDCPYCDAGAPSHCRHYTTPAPVAETAGEALWFEKGFTSPNVPAQDDDKLRIAVEALEPFSEAARMAEISGRPPFEFCDASDYQRAASTSVRLKTEVQP